MVESLKRSLEHLDPPICPNCHLDMKWYRSTLGAPEPITIAHLFFCPNCHRVADTKSVLPSGAVAPPKLSAPLRRLLAEAA